MADLLEGRLFIAPALSEGALRHLRLAGRDPCLPRLRVLADHKGKVAAALKHLAWYCLECALPLLLQETTTPFATLFILLRPYITKRIERWLRKGRIKSYTMDEAVPEQSPLEAYLNGNLNKSGPGAVPGPPSYPHRQIAAWRQVANDTSSTDATPLASVNEHNPIGDTDMLSTKSRSSSRHSSYSAASLSPNDARTHRRTASSASYSSPETNFQKPSFAPRGTPTVASRFKTRLSNPLTVDIPPSAHPGVIYRTYSVNLTSLLTRAE